MSNVIGNIIADSLSRGLDYAQRLAAGIPADQFARFADGKDGPIVSNHPAFIFGHLSIYAPRIVEQLGHDAAPYKLPDDQHDLFAPSATCQDDPDGSLYPAMTAIMDRFTTSYQAALQVLRDANDQQFAEVNPAEGRMRELFPTLGSMHAFYCGGHLMMHMGQLRAWRRMQGMPSA
ncbi:MAG: DinB family protein [Pirellulaceae bacterium]